MVRTVHYECHSRRYLAELAYNQPVAVEIIMMQYMLLKVCIAEIREVSDYYVRVLYGWLDVCDGIATPYRENHVWIRSHFRFFRILVISHIYSIFKAR